jgi:hypothetical protein
MRLRVTTTHTRTRSVCLIKDYRRAAYRADLHFIAGAQSLWRLPCPTNSNHFSPTTTKSGFIAEKNLDWRAYFRPVPNSASFSRKPTGTRSLRRRRAGLLASYGHPNNPLPESDTVRNNCRIVRYAPLMEHRGIPYQVVQTASPSGWRWTVQLDDIRTRTGTTFSKGNAIFRAISAIEKALGASPTSET